MVQINKKNFDRIFPPDCSIVFLHAHCDDESFLSAGLLNKLSDTGKQCFIIYGAAGAVESHEKSKIRQEQTISACQILGQKSVEFLNYCEPKIGDTKIHPLCEERIEDVGRAVWDMVQKNRIKIPIVLVSYDKNGGYGNADHKIIHLIGREIKNKHKESVVLYEITINRDKMQAWIVDSTGKLTPDLLPKLKYWSPEYGLTENEINYFYELSNTELSLKHKALACHKFYNRYNCFPLGLPKNEFAKVLGVEFLHKPIF